MKYIEYIGRASMDIRRKPLSTLEQKVVNLLSEGKTYSFIGGELGYEDGYVGDVAREMYGLIGQKLRVKVTRSNLFSVIDSALGGEMDDSFYACHKIAPNEVVNPGVLRFHQESIVINVSLFWKFDAVNFALILKAKNPVVINLREINNENLGTALINLSQQQQVSGDSLLELCKILSKYFA